MFHKDLADACHKLLKEGVAELGMPVGIVSHIYSGLYHIVAINHPMGEMISGAVFPLSDTYCRDVFTTKKTIAITEIDGVEGLRLHPLYATLPLEAYISAPIFHQDKQVVWGTVNFTSPKTRTAFTAADIKLVENYAKQISQWLAIMNKPKRKASRKRTIAEQHAAQMNRPKHTPLLF